jgi:hypothetical protein
MMHPTLISARWLLTCSLFVSVLAFPAAAQQHASNASFTSPGDVDLLEHIFDLDISGVYRKGGPGTTFNFSIFNLPSATAPMSLFGTPLGVGHTSSMVLSPVAISGLPPGGSSPLSLTLNTSMSGNLSVSYYIDFKSDGFPGEFPQTLNLVGRAKVYPRGDYDLDFDVDNADKTLWRSKYGTNFANADGNENGIVDTADYVVWRKNYTGPGSGEGQSFADGLSNYGATPEPTSISLALLSAAVGSLLFKRRSR